MTIDTAKDKIISFLVTNGLPQDSKLERIFEGANNKVFQVSTDNHNFLLKVYFKDSGDPRDRLKSEFSFCKFAWGKGIRSLPQPVAYDYQNQLALYEFIEGRRLRREDINQNLVLCAFNFYQDLNNYKQCKDAKDLALASEAYFSIKKHLIGVEKRIKNLKDIKGTSKVNLAARDFINTELLAAWQQVRNGVINKAEGYGFILDEEIKNEEKRLSPSDFGFHNAILTNSGGLRFIDFEYAGWDDPAKMACDFFCQPKVAVPFDYLSMFVNRVISTLPQPEKVAERIYVLFPLYQLKWCCILLNDFLPVDSHRRKFAFEIINNDEFKIKQLNKARHYLENLIHTDYNQLFIRDQIFGNGSGSAH